MFFAILTIESALPDSQTRCHPLLTDLFDLEILSLYFNIVVGAVGPETDFTIEKDWTSGHQVVTKRSPGGNQVVTK